METGDQGDPKKDVAVRDTLFLLDAPFDGTPRKLLELPLRFRSVAWAQNHLVLVEERRWKDRKRIILAAPPSGSRCNCSRDRLKTATTIPASQWKR